MNPVWWPTCSGGGCTPSGPRPRVGFSMVVPRHSPCGGPHTCPALTWSEHPWLPASPARVCPLPRLRDTCLRPQPLANGQPCPRPRLPSPSCLLCHNPPEYTLKIHIPGPTRGPTKPRAGHVRPPPRASLMGPPVTSSWEGPLCTATPLLECLWGRGTRSSQNLQTLTIRQGSCSCPSGFPLGLVPLCTPDGACPAAVQRDPPPDTGPPKEARRLLLPVWSTGGPAAA